MEESGRQNINDGPSNVWPNYFVAVQVSNPIIHENIFKIQEHILNQDDCLKRVMIDPSTLHITMMVMNIKDTETHTRAIRALRNAHREFNNVLSTCSVTLEFNGLGHFNNNKVLFAKIQENKGLELLHTLSEIVRTCFAEESILSTDRREFNPHLTIAKIGYRQRVRRINPLFYEEYINQYIGSETINNIQLLKMSERDESGYYVGDKLLFC